MKKNINIFAACAGLSIAVAMNFAQAAVSPEEAKQLGKTLTPFGAEVAGNKDGTIPKWEGGITSPPKEYTKPGQHHPDPFTADKPLFTITASNLDKYAHKLTEGQKAMFKAYPETFSMPVYQTRRTHSAPEKVYENTKKNALSASLANNGNGVNNAYGGIPFPITKDGLEAIWNHILRWRFEHGEFRVSEAVVNRDGRYSLAINEQEIVMDYYTAGSFDKLDNILLRYLAITKAPARLAGAAVLVHETMNQSESDGGLPRQAWAYNPGQRRVRRAPSLAFDTPSTEAEGLSTIDDFDMYNGSPQRYDWKLVGKKEIYIPYNNYQLGSAQLGYEDILNAGHVNPNYTRYELHRVWVVEATLKEGLRHLYTKRKFFMDEDSWSVVLADQYNDRGELWRTNFSYLKNYYEIPATWTSVNIYHDLQAKRYFAQGLTNEEDTTLDISGDIPEKSHFTPSALRRMGRR